MPPRTALVAKLAARKQLIQAAAAATAADTHTAHTAAADTSDTAAATATAPKRAVQSRKQAAARSAATAAAAAAASTPAAVPTAPTSSEDDESESESESSEDASSSSSSSSAYSASEDEVDAEGRRKYRIFVCPLPASCAPAHAKPSKTAAAKAKSAGAAPITTKDPFALPPPTPSPCAAAIQSLYAATLRERFGSFGAVIAVDVRSKVGFAPLAAGTASADGAAAVDRTVPLGMKSCPDCLACPQCSDHEQFHYAFLTLHTTLAQVESLIKAFRNSKFRGEFVRVERAKLDYRPRMLDERHKDKKKKHLNALREAKKIDTQKQMGREGLPRELGSVAYEFKHPHGGKIFPLTESVPTRDFPEADKVTALPISQLDWEEKGPPDPASLPRAPIDYELLAALFSGISSDAATVAKAAAAGGAVVRKKGGRKMNQKDEEDEWGALERGDTEAGKDKTKDDEQEDDDEAMAPAPAAAAPKDVPSDDEWAMLERGSAEPPVAPAPAKTVAPSPKLVAAAVPAAKTKAAAVAAASAAAKIVAAKKPSPKVAPVAAPETDDMDLDAEFAALEHSDDEDAEEDDDEDDEAEAEEEEEAEEPEPAPVVPAKKAVAAKPAAKPAKAAAAPNVASPALAPVKPVSKAAAAAKPSPALAPTVAPAAAALGVKKLTPASSWLGSDDDEDDGSDADAASKPAASSLDDAAAEDAAEEEQLTLRRAFHGAKGEEMRALERSFGGDARFKMDARFEEVDEAAAVAASLANPLPGPLISSDVAPSLHPSLAALSPQELLRQQLLGEKRRALSILDQVAARPGYATLSLEELAESEAKAAKDSFEHSNLPAGKSAKSLQLEAQGGIAKGKRRPDAHYTKSSFEDTMEFMSDFVPAGAASLATEGLIGESEVTPGEATREQISSQISASLLRWMPLTADAASAGQSIQDRIAIEAEDEELARRKKLRYWKDAPRFDPSKEPEPAAIDTAAASAAVAPPKPSAADAAAKSKSKPAVAPSRLALYTPQPAPSVAAPLARDGEALFEIKTERLRNLFTQPAPAVSFSFAAQDLPADDKPVQAFKFNFADNAEDDNNAEDKAAVPEPVAAKKTALKFSAAPTKPAAPAPPSPRAAPVAAAAPAAAPVAASSSASASSSFHIPSWPEGHPNNPYKSNPRSMPDKPRQPQQSALPKLPPPKNPNVARASAFVKSLAAAAAVGSKRKAAPVDSSDSDSDEDGFMRSSNATPEALASKWESARAAHTHDFKSKNKSATRKSGLNAMGTGMGARAAGAAGAMQRNTTQQAMGILEQSGDYKKKQRR